MLTRRWGTLVVAVGWIASWGLVFVHGMFALVPGIPLLVAFMTVPFIVEHYRLEFFSDLNFVYCPITRRHVRQNARARLRRRIAALAERKKVCRELIETEEETTRIPVLEAERDAAEREIARLWDDIELFEAGWEREDRERKYRELTR